MEQVNRAVNAILHSPQINNKIVVLVEGDVPPLDGQRLSPQRYAQYERLPDANFYKACVPRRWHNSRTPVFFNCGGRSQVLHVYQALLEEHDKAPENSYLKPEKLYALVDLDVQSEKLPPGYPWTTTENVHIELYDDGAVKAFLDDRHRIWVTSLVHKEAYFILPSIASCLTGGVTPYWNGMPLDLRAIHAAIAEKLAVDCDVCNHFDIVKMRQTRFAAGSSLACTDAARLGQSWLDAAKAASNEEYESLAKSLLAVAKAKVVWKEIVPEPTYGLTMDAESFRDQLELEIGRFIASLEPSAHPLAGFFAWLEPRR